MPALLAAALVPLLAVAGRAAPGLSIAPAASGAKAVRNGQYVTVSGSADGDLTAGALLARQDNGTVLRLPLGDESIGRPSGSDQYVRDDQGTISGRLGLSCVFAPPEAFCPVEHRAVVAVSLELTVAGQTLTSPELRVDFTRPYIIGYRTATPSRIQARFDEPVQGDDSPLDWQVANDLVTSVSTATGDCTFLADTDPGRAGRSGCTRLLDLALPLGQDAQPVVTYAPPANRPLYVDDALNAVDRSSATTATTSAAADGVAPAPPTVSSIAGKAPSGGSVTAAQPSPVVTLDGLTRGHLATIYLESGRTPGLQPAEDGVLAQGTADGSTASFQLPAFPQDGSYRLYATATDPSGNESSAVAVSYVLDTVPLVFVRATTDRTSTVTVFFTKPVTGTDSPLDWRITRPDGSSAPVTAVTGSGAMRMLSASNVPAGSTVTYQPAPGSSYRDAVGNTLPASSRVIAVVPAPLLSAPTAPAYTTATTATVSGTVQPGLAVDVFRRDASGAPVGAAVATASPADGAFSFTVPLTSDADNRFALVARDGSGATSDPTSVPTITQDAAPPTLSGSAPAAGAFLAGGQPTTIRYTYSDTHPAAAPVAIEFAADGVNYTPVTGGAPASGSYTWQVPRLNTSGALLRLRAVDAAGRTSDPVVLGPFTIDSVPPVFLPRTADPRTVVVTFSEPGVTGSTSSADWRIDGTPVSSASAVTRPDGVLVVTLTTAPTQQLGPAATPQVTYAPTALATQYRDRAGQPIPDAARSVTAADGIPPAAPYVSVPSGPVLTSQDSVEVRGTGEAGTTLQLLDGTGRYAAQATVAADGTWSAAARLLPDRVTMLRAVLVDAAGNTSPSSGVPSIEQDSTDPRVEVTAPASGSTVAPGSSVTVRWTSSDRNLRDYATTVEASTDGGRTWALLARDQAATGSLVWQVPQTMTSQAFLRVTTPDAAGRTGTGLAGPIGIGQPAASSAGPANASPSPPSPSPSQFAPLPGGGPASSPSPSDGSPTAGPSGSPTAGPSGSPTAGPSGSPSLAPLSPAGTFHGLTPDRLLDTRLSRRPLGPGGTLHLQVAGRGGVPRSGAAAVVLNLTAVQPTAKTHVTVVPTGRDNEATADLTAAAGQTVADAVVVRLGPDGGLDLRNQSGSTHLVVDVFGWYADDSGAPGDAFAPITPQRLLDTRQSGAPLAAGRTLDLQVTGRGGVPSSGVTAVVLGVAALLPEERTHVTVWPAGQPRPGTSNLNIEAHDRVANLVTVPVGPDGKVSLAAAGTSVHLVADVFGWYGAAATDVFMPVDPARLVDTRTDRRPLVAGQELTVPVAGHGGVPADGVDAAVLVVTAVAPTRTTHLTLYAGGTRVPDTAHLNATRGATVTGLVVVPVGKDGTVRVVTGGGSVHVVVDVAGWFRRR